MFGMSPSHLLVLGLVALLFGARRLPELGSSLGKSIRAFKEAVDGKSVEISQNPESPETKSES